MRHVDPQSQRTGAQEMRLLGLDPLNKRPVPSKIIGVLFNEKGLGREALFRREPTDWAQLRLPTKGISPQSKETISTSGSRAMHNRVRSVVPAAIPEKS